MITKEQLKKYDIKSATRFFEPDSMGDRTTIIIRFNDGRVERKEALNDGTLLEVSEEFMLSLVIHKERNKKIQKIKSLLC